MADTQEKDTYSKARNWVRFLLIVLTITVIGIVFSRGVTSALRSETLAEKGGWILASVIISIIVVSFSFAVWKWDEVTERLENLFKLVPTFRKWFIFPGVLASLGFGIIQLAYWDTEVTLKIIVALYFGLTLPAAIISLIRDDRLREKALLSANISREYFSQNTQASVAHAFTSMETRLREKTGLGTDVYGETLINEAFAGEKSILKLILDGKDYTSQLRNFMSGAYGLLRNPRHHRLIEDDEHTALAVFEVAVLMSNFIDASEPRNLDDKNKDLTNR